MVLFWNLRQWHTLGSCKLLAGSKLLYKVARRLDSLRSCSLPLNYGLPLLAGAVGYTTSSLRGPGHVAEFLGQISVLNGDPHTTTYSLRHPSQTPDMPSKAAQATREAENSFRTRLFSKCPASPVLVLCSTILASCSDHLCPGMSPARKICSVLLACHLHRHRFNSRQNFRTCPRQFRMEADKTCSIGWQLACRWPVQLPPRRHVITWSMLNFLGKRRMVRQEPKIPILDSSGYLWPGLHDALIPAARISDLFHLGAL